MQIYFTNDTAESNSADINYVRNQMIKYNLKHFPDDLKGRYEEVNLFVEECGRSDFGRNCGGNMLELAGDPLLVRG